MPSTRTPSNWKSPYTADSNHPVDIDEATTDEAVTAVRDEKARSGGCDD
jgi:hypothetical protein